MSGAMYVLLVSESEDVLCAADKGREEAQLSGRIQLTVFFLLCCFERKVSEMDIISIRAEKYIPDLIRDVFGGVMILFGHSANHTFDTFVPFLFSSPSLFPCFRCCLWWLILLQHHLHCPPRNFAILCLDDTHNSPVCLCLYDWSIDPHT